MQAAADKERLASLANLRRELRQFRKEARRPSSPVALAFAESESWEHLPAASTSTPLRRDAAAVRQRLRAASSGSSPASAALIQAVVSRDRAEIQELR